MTKFNYFKTSEFEVQLSSKELLDVDKSASLEEYREEWQARLNIMRQVLGLPIYINSWYRDPAHNARVGGSSTSQHMDGTAVDIRCSDNGKLLQVVKQLIDKYGMDFGQVITYGSASIRFIHLSLPTRGKLNQFLTKP